MNNSERREALNTARTNAVAWAERCQSEYPQGRDYLDQQIGMACMWAAVAEALKTSDATADSPNIL